MDKFKIIVTLLAVVVLSVLFLLIKPDNVKSSKVVVSLSTFSLYDIARHIAEDDIELVMILPFGVDPHSFEPTPKLMAKISKSDLVVYNGAGLEPWIDGFDFHGKVIDMSKHVKLKKLDAHHHHHSIKHKNSSNLDPHYWLDVNNMIQML
jgi:zinc transport system substrate-binding protein